MKRGLYIFWAIVFFSTTQVFAQEEIIVRAFPNLSDHIKNAIPLFEKEAGIKVRLIINEYNDHHTKLATDMVVGKGLGDVVVVELGFWGGFVDTGVFEMLDKSPYNAHGLEWAYVPFAWKQALGVDGRLYGIPADIGPAVLFYRQDYLEKAGMTEAEMTAGWDSYIAFGEKLKEHGIFLLADSSDVTRMIRESEALEGEGFFYDSRGNSLIETSRNKKSFMITKEIQDKDLDAMVLAWTPEWGVAYKDGRVATMTAGAWMEGHLSSWIAPNLSGKWRATFLPGKSMASQGGSFYAIPKSSSYKDEAWKFIEFLASDEMHLAAMRSIGAFPSRETTYDDDIFTEPVDYLGGQQARLIYAEVAKNIIPVTLRKVDLIAFHIIQDALMQVLEEQKTVDQALKDADRLIRSRMRER